MRHVIKQYMTMTPAQKAAWEALRNPDPTQPQWNASKFWWDQTRRPIFVCRLVALDIWVNPRVEHFYTVYKMSNYERTGYYTFKRDHFKRTFSGHPEMLAAIAAMEMLKNA